MIKALREGLAGNRIDRVAGILNGTWQLYPDGDDASTEHDFADVLAEAQRLGYAEADPSFRRGWHRCRAQAGDFGGARVQPAGGLPRGACGGHPGRSRRRTSPLPAELGYRIKLLGIARRGADAGIEARVHPCMVPMTAPIRSAHVDGVFNAVVAEGDFGRAG